MKFLDDSERISWAEVLVTLGVLAVIGLIAWGLA